MSELIDAGIVKDLKSGEGTWMFSESGDTYEFYKGTVYGYDSEPTEKDWADIFDAEEITSWVKSYLKKEYPDLVKAYLEAEDEYGIDFVKWLEDEGAEFDWHYKSGDNTYNWSYLGPGTISFYTFEAPDGDTVTFYSIHRGGDVRGNYGNWFVHKDSYEVGFIECFSGMASVFLTFKDGSDITFDAEQDSDVWRFRMYRMKGKPSSLAQKWYDFIEESGLQNDWELDDELDDVLSAIE